MSLETRFAPAKRSISIHTNGSIFEPLRTGINGIQGWRFKDLPVHTSEIKWTAHQTTITSIEMMFNLRRTLFLRKINLPNVLGQSGSHQLALSRRGSSVVTNCHYSMS
jgi:hypothetical protein